MISPMSMCAKDSFRKASEKRPKPYLYGGVVSALQHVSLWNSDELVFDCLQVVVLFTGGDRWLKLTVKLCCPNSCVE